MLFLRHLLQLLDELDVDFKVLGLEAGEHAAKVAFWNVSGGFDLAAQHPFANWRVAIVTAVSVYVPKTRGGGIIGREDLRNDCDPFLCTDLSNTICKWLGLPKRKLHLHCYNLCDRRCLLNSVCIDLAECYTSNLTFLD